MTNFFKMALMGIFAVGAFAACSDSDDDNGGGATPEPEPVGVPTIELSGAQTSGSEASSLTFSVKLTDATSAKYLMTTSSELQNAMTDATLEELILENGTDLSSEQLGTALSGGLDLVFKSLEPIMEYTCAIMPSTANKRPSRRFPYRPPMAVPEPVREPMPTMHGSVRGT